MIPISSYRYILSLRTQSGFKSTKPKLLLQFCKRLPQAIHVNSWSRNVNSGVSFTEANFLVHIQSMEAGSRLHERPIKKISVVRHKYVRFHLKKITQMKKKNNVTLA